MSIVQVFCCYSHEDRALLERLKTHLAPFRREGLISIWDDCDVSPGTVREEEIQEQLKAADIILLLISPSFIASDYCYSVGMKLALERHQRREARVIPLLLRPTHWQDVPVLRELQPLPREGKPVTDRHWRDQDEAFHTISTGIRDSIHSLPDKQVPVTRPDEKSNHDTVVSAHPASGDITNVIPPGHAPILPPGASAQPASRDSAKGKRLVKGSGDFIGNLESLPEPAKDLLQKLYTWALSLEQAQLTQLYTYYGTGDALTLLPRPKVDDAGFVAIHNHHGTVAIQFWRSVFERRAPHILAAIEETGTPIRQGNSSHEVSDDLLEMLTEAYREAVR